VADPTQAFGGQSDGGTTKSLHLFNAHGCLQQSLGITQNLLPFVGQKVTMLVGRTNYTIFQGITTV